MVGRGMILRKNPVRRRTRDRLLMQAGGLLVMGIYQKQTLHLSSRQLTPLRYVLFWLFLRCITLAKLTCRKG